jgi:uncharacterized membrane protein
MRQALHVQVSLGSSERRRVVVCSIAGIVVGSVVALTTVWQLVVLVGWSVTAISLLLWIWFDIGRLDHEITSRVATREDDSPNAARGVLLASSLMSLLAIGAALHRASTARFALAVALTVTSVLAVALSWVVVHTVFTLRYARLFYRESSGIDFPGGAPPSYRDFAYLAFTVGMTFQVSDTAITDRTLRATVLRHAVLSYVFSIAIIAVMINVIAGIVA